MEALPVAGRRAARRGWRRLCRGLLASSRRKKQHADLAANSGTRRGAPARDRSDCPAADKYLPLVYPEPASAFDYLPENALVLIEDTPRLRAAARDFHARIADDVTALHGARRAAGQAWTATRWISPGCAA